MEKLPHVLLVEDDDTTNYLNKLLLKRLDAQVRVRYGRQRLCILLRREGWPDNHKRVH